MLHKNRLKEEGNETVTNCNKLKMPAADGKMRLTDAASAQQLLRLIQSVPSFKNGRLIMTAGTIPQAEYPHKTLQNR